MGEYKNSNAWIKLVSYRYYINNPSGIYYVVVTMRASAPNTIRHGFEGEKEGPIVMWPIPQS